MLKTILEHRFIAFAGLEVLGKLAFMLLLPIASFHKDFYDFEKFSYFVNIMQSSLPIFSAGAIVFIATEARSRKQWLQKVLGLSIALVIIVFLIQLAVSSDYEISLYTGTIGFFAVLFPVMNFMIVYYDRNKLFLSGYLPKIAFSLIIFVGPFLLGGVESLVLLLISIYLIYLAWILFRFEIYVDFDFRSIFYSSGYIKRALPILLIAIVGLGYLVLPKYYATETSSFVVLSYLQILQAFFIFLFGVVIRFYTKEIYQTHLARSFVNKYGILVIVFYTILLLFFVVFFSTGLVLVFSLDFQTLSKYSILMFVLLYFYLFYALAYDYSISQERGFVILLSYIASICLAFVAYVYTSHVLGWSMFLYLVFFNTVHYLIVYCTSFGVRSIYPILLPSSVVMVFSVFFMEDFLISIYSSSVIKYINITGA